ncbi:MAG: hypothetical protein ACRDQF_21225, partial [Thermocrispum sp.]
DYVSGAMRVPDIGVGPQSLRAAAKGSREMAVELRAIEARVADRVKRAMPKSAAGQAAVVGDNWDEKLKKLTTALDERAEKPTAAGDQCDSGERDSSDDFHSQLARDPEARFPGR